jgi:hypothetical protein
MPYNTDGGTPYGTMILGTDGNFYGTMSSGGTYYVGVVFKITPDGLYTKLRQLNPTTNGGDPRGSLVQGIVGSQCTKPQHRGRIGQSHYTCRLRRHKPYVQRINKATPWFGYKRHCSSTYLHTGYQFLWRGFLCLHSQPGLFVISTGLGEGFRKPGERHTGAGAHW